mgnify:CR=1 FL=1
MTKNSTARQDTSVDTLHAADGLGFEARSATGDHAALKLWLRHELEKESRSEIEGIDLKEHAESAYELASSSRGGASL